MSWLASGGFSGQTPGLWWERAAARKPPVRALDVTQAIFVCWLASLSIVWLVGWLVGREFLSAYSSKWLTHCARDEYKLILTLTLRQSEQPYPWPQDNQAKPRVSGELY